MRATFQDTENPVRSQSREPTPKPVTPKQTSNVPLVRTNSPRPGGRATTPQLVYDAHPSPTSAPPLVARSRSDSTQYRSVSAHGPTLAHLQRDQAHEHAFESTVVHDLHFPLDTAANNARSKAFYSQHTTTSNTALSSVPPYLSLAHSTPHTSQGDATPSSQTSDPEPNHTTVSSPSSTAATTTTSVSSVSTLSEDEEALDMSSGSPSGSSRPSSSGRGRSSTNRRPQRQQSYASSTQAYPPPPVDPSPSSAPSYHVHPERQPPHGYHQPQPPSATGAGPPYLQPSHRAGPPATYAGGHYAVPLSPSSSALQGLMRQPAYAYPSHMSVHAGMSDPSGIGSATLGTASGGQAQQQQQMMGMSPYGTPPAIYPYSPWGHSSEGSSSSSQSHSYGGGGAPSSSGVGTTSSTAPAGPSTLYASHTFSPHAHSHHPSPPPHSPLSPSHPPPSSYAQHRYAQPVPYVYSSVPHTQSFSPGPMMPPPHPSMYSHPHQPSQYPGSYAYPPPPNTTTSPTHTHGQYSPDTGVNGGGLGGDQQPQQGTWWYLPAQGLQVGTGGYDAYTSAYGGPHPPPTYGGMYTGSGGGAEASYVGQVGQISQQGYSHGLNPRLNTSGLSLGTGNPLLVPHQHQQASPRSPYPGSGHGRGRGQGEDPSPPNSASLRPHPSLLSQAAAPPSPELPPLNPLLGSRPESTPTTGPRPAGPVGIVGGATERPNRKAYHPNPPAHRSEWVMWAGNVPSDATHDELWRFFNSMGGIGPASSGSEGSGSGSGSGSGGVLTESSSGMTGMSARSAPVAFGGVGSSRGVSVRGAIGGGPLSPAGAHPNPLAVGAMGGGAGTGGVRVVSGPASLPSPPTLRGAPPMNIPGSQHHPMSPSSAGHASLAGSGLGGTSPPLHGGVSSIFLISRSNCAFVNFQSAAYLHAAIARFNGLSLRPNDPRCPRLVCRVRGKEDDLKAGVGGQRGAGIHTRWIKDQREREAAAKREMERERRGSSSGVSDQLTSSETPSSSPSERPPMFGPLSDEEAIAGAPVMSTVSPGGVRRGHARGKPAPAHSGSSGSFASTNSSILVQYFPKRYFILKSLTQFDLDLSVEKGLWATQKHNEGILDQAFRTSREVYLIFGVNKSGEFYGYAKMASGTRGENRDRVSWASRTNTNDSSPSSLRRLSSQSLSGFSAAAESPTTISRPGGHTFFSPGDQHYVEDSPLPMSNPVTHASPSSRPEAPALNRERDAFSAPAELHDPHHQLSVFTNPPPQGQVSLDAKKLFPAASMLLQKKDEEREDGFELDENAPERVAKERSRPSDAHTRFGGGSGSGSSSVGSSSAAIRDEHGVKRWDAVSLDSSLEVVEEVDEKGSGETHNTPQNANALSTKPHSPTAPVEEDPNPMMNALLDEYRLQQQENSLKGKERAQSHPDGHAQSGPSEAHAGIPNAVVAEAPVWGESFKVEWIRTDRLPFYRTRHIRNPWNHDREVKVSRDGTELEPSVGQALLEEWDKLDLDGVPATAAPGPSRGVDTTKRPGAGKVVASDDVVARGARE